MTQYERGRSFEYRVKKHYERKGYFVMRSAGSHGPADLIALKCHAPAADVILIQCKAGRANPTQKEICRLVKLGWKLNVLTVMAMRELPPGRGIIFADAEKLRRGYAEND